MAQFIFSSTKQKDAAIRNSRRNLTIDNQTGRDTRKSFFRITKNKMFREKNFQKRQDQGKTYSKKEITTAITLGNKNATKELKKDWKSLRKEEKKRGVKVKNRTKWKEFQEANTQPDFDEIKESFNSPT